MVNGHSTLAYYFPIKAIHRRQGRSSVLTYQKDIYCFIPVCKRAISKSSRRYKRRKGRQGSTIRSTRGSLELSRLNEVADLSKD